MIIIRITFNDLIGLEQMMARMITFDEGDTRFTQRVVGIALDRGRVLLHRTDDMTFWALPGGRAELLESSPDTLVRETLALPARASVLEEIDTEVTVGRLLWVAENFFVHLGYSFHEVGFYFLMHLPADSSLCDQPAFLGREDEQRVIFEWHPIETLDQVALYPQFLRTGLKSLPAHTTHLVHRAADSPQP
jgi:8-oxo-dGTP pyrophosphatase MutT (NUDIX family)